MDDDFELTGGSATIRDAIRKILSNRASNSKRRYAKQARIAERLENEARRDRILKNYPELEQKRLLRNARAKAQRRVKEAELSGAKAAAKASETQPKPKEKTHKAEPKPHLPPEREREIKPWSRFVTEKLPNGQVLEYDEVQNAIDELEPYGIVDKKTWRQFAKVHHPDRIWEHGYDNDFSNEQFAHVMAQYEIVRKAGVPGFS